MVSREIGCAQDVFLRFSAYIHNQYGVSISDVMNVFFEYRDFIHMYITNYDVWDYEDVFYIDEMEMNFENEFKFIKNWGLYLKEKKLIPFLKKQKDKRMKSNKILIN